MTRSIRHSHTWLAALVAALGLLAAPLAAGETDDHAHAQVAHADSGTQEAHGAEEAHDEHDAAGEHGEAEGHFAGHAVHHEHKNGLALFLGGTYETHEEENFFTVGLEYERKLSDRWAFQAIVEHVNDFDAWVVTVPVGFRLGSTLWLMAGPGLETEARRTGLEAEPHHDEHDTGNDDGHSVEPHEEEEGPFFLWRFGLIYGIHLGESGRWALTPSLSLDLVREHGEWAKAWVFGVGLTCHF